MTELRADRPLRPMPAARARPDSRPLRIAYGMGGIAAASALVTALVTTGSSSTATPATQTLTLGVDPPPVARHVVQYIKLKPGQAAPPQAVVKQAPTPKPRVVVVTTHQSGTKP